MTAGRALLADLYARGIQVETDGELLRWRPSFLVTTVLAQQIHQHQREIIDLLSDLSWLARCPKCRWWLDAEDRCPKCFDRRCRCGQLTGSYFIESCITCGGVASNHEGV